MKKLLFISLVCLASSSFAITVQPSTTTGSLGNNTEPNIYRITAKSKTGRVVVFDKTQSVAVIGEHSYTLNEQTRIYDGIPKKGSLVKFTVDKDNLISDIWIIQ